MTVYTLQIADSPNLKKIEHINISILNLSDAFKFYSVRLLLVSPVLQRKKKGFHHPATRVVGRDFNVDFT